MDIDEVIEAGGGPMKLGRALGMTHSAIIAWRRSGRIPAERVPDVERVTRIPRHRLRPDLWEPPAGALVADAEAVT